MKRELRRLSSLHDRLEMDCDKRLGVRGWGCASVLPWIPQAERRVAQLRTFVGPQVLLDVLRVHVCTSSAVRFSRRASRTSMAKSASPDTAPDGAVICRPVSPRRHDGGEQSKPTATTKPLLERCIGACMRMLRVMLSSELSSSPPAANASSGSSPATDADQLGVLNPAAGGIAGGGAGGAGADGVGGGHGARDSLTAGAGVFSAETYSQLAFLEGGFGDGFDVSDGAGKVRDAQGAEGDHGGIAGGGAEASGGGIEATLVCLAECHSHVLQRGLLEVLLGLRDERPTALRRELLRWVLMFVFVGIVV